MRVSFNHAIECCKIQNDRFIVVASIFMCIRLCIFTYVWNRNEQKWISDRGVNDGKKSLILCLIWCWTAHFNTTWHCCKHIERMEMIANVNENNKHHHKFGFTTAIPASSISATTRWRKRTTKTALTATERHNCTQNTCIGNFAAEQEYQRLSYRIRIASHRIPNVCLSTKYIHMYEKS